MRRLAAAAAAMAAIALAPRAAFPCGASGGGSSSGGSSSGGSSSSSDGGGSSSSSEPSCVEVSSVVGRWVCPSSRFGTWNVAHFPRLRLHFGTSGHRFPVRNMTFDGTAPHGDGIAYSMVGSDITNGLAGAATFDLGLSINVSRHLYAGLEGKIGHAWLHGQTTDASADLMMNASGTLYSELGGVAGLVVPIGDFDLRAETFVGARLVGVSVDSVHGACADTSYAYDASWLVEPRVAVESWITPWATLGVQAGANALQRDDISLGVYLQGHLRAFDAFRSR